VGVKQQWNDRRPFIPSPSKDRFKKGGGGRFNKLIPSFCNEKKKKGVTNQ
jgi:hypothetical protein